MVRDIRKAMNEENSCSFYSVLPVGAKQSLLAYEDFRKAKFLLSCPVPSQFRMEAGV